MNVYTIYNKEFAPEALKNKQPTAPTYRDDNLADSIDVMLFIHTLEDVTGVEAENIIIIDETEEELSNEDFDAMIDQLLTSAQIGSEIQMVKWRGRYLYDTRFKKQEVLN